MSDFARLETHEGLQVLARVEAITNDEGEYGPALITRCDPSMTIEITEGPFGDDENGWDAAEKAMAGKDLKSFADTAIALSARFTEPVGRDQ